MHILTVMLALAMGVACASVSRAGESAGMAPVATVQASERRPVEKMPKRGQFPFKGWSYAKAYTYNFFKPRPVQMRVLSPDGRWSEHIRSEQRVADDVARRAAALAAETRGSIEMTKCTFPRHAIVYFDAGDRPVASVDVCFECEAVIAWPDYQKAETYDWDHAAQRFERTLVKWRRLFETDLGLAIEYGDQSGP